MQQTPQIFDSKELVVMTKLEAQALVKIFLGYRPRSREEARDMEASGVYEVLHALSEAAK